MVMLVYQRVTYDTRLIRFNMDCTLWYAYTQLWKITMFDGKAHLFPWPPIDLPCVLHRFIRFFIGKMTVKKRRLQANGGLTAKTPRGGSA